MPVHILPPDVPRNDKALAVLLHRMFGIGQPSEGEDENDPEDWRFAVREGAKVKCSRTKRGASLAELHVAALYCQAHGFRVDGVTWLYPHIAAAWRWWDGREPPPTDLDEEFTEAIRYEMREHGPDSEWLGRLLRTSPQWRAEVLAEYRADA